MNKIFYNNNCLIRNECKLNIYSQDVLPAIRFKVTGHELLNTNMSTLDALSDSYIKKWLHIPQSDTLAIIQAKEGLNITCLSHLYREVHIISYAHPGLRLISR